MDACAPVPVVRPTSRKPKKNGRKGARSCATGKRRYRDKREADHVLHGAASYPKRGVIPRRAYYCDRCHGWHLTSKDEWPSKERWEAES